jgi:hypothetical protein
MLKASANRVGEVSERCGVSWMTGRVKGKSLSVALDGLLQILHPSKLLKASENIAGEVIERHGATWMTRRVKGESLSVVLNGLL